MLEYRDPKTLKPHPENVAIYGEDVPDESFDKSISRDGVLSPLLILPDGTIISGHRRCQAAIRCGIEDVPVIVKLDMEDRPLQVVEYLIASNSQRIKSAATLAFEADRLTSVLGGLAVERKKWFLNRGTVSPVVESHSTTGKQGKTRKIVGKALGVNEKKAEQLAVVGKAIREAKERGDHATVAKITKSVNESLPKAAESLREPKADKPPVAQKPKRICPHCHQDMKD